MYNLFMERNTVRGVYLLIIEIQKPLTIVIGNTRYKLEPGYYIYVGSAWGPGGLRSRIARHIRKDKKIHWHIDRITSTPFTAVKTICLLPGAPPYYESRIAGILSAKLDFIPGFGSTDRRGDTSHLFICGTYSKCVETVRSLEKTIKYPIIFITLY